MELTVYGAELLCASCLNAPSSRETYEWLEAAIKRRFPEAPLSLRYVDINKPVTEEDRHFTDEIKKDTYFFPLVVGAGQVLGEGNLRLKPIFEYLEALG